MVRHGRGRREKTVLEVLPAAQHYGLGVIPWSPLHGGVLSGVLRKQKEGPVDQAGRVCSRRPAPNGAKPE